MVGAEPGPGSADELEIGSAPRDPAAPAPWIPGAQGLPARGAGVGLPDDVGVDRDMDKRRARADRRVATFDFEETNDVGVKLGRGVPLPPGWYAVGRPPQSNDANFARLALHADLTGRPGFPPYNPVGYSQVGQGREASGGGNDPEGYALHLGLRGGNSAAFLQVGRLPVVPGTRYRVTAAVRTAGLEHWSMLGRGWWGFTSTRRATGWARPCGRRRGCRPAAPGGRWSWCWTATRRGRRIWACRWSWCSRWPTRCTRWVNTRWCRAT